MTTTRLNLMAALGELLRERIGLPRYKLWFEDKTRMTWSDDVLVVGVSNHFYQEWLEKTFVDAIRTAARAAFGQDIRVRFTIDPELFQAARRRQMHEQPMAAVPLVRGSSVEDRGSVEPDQRDLPLLANRPGTTGQGAARQGGPALAPLADFVVGACNRVAHASALNLIEEPGLGASPLVLHGPVGAGKTHLLEGIYAGLRKSRADWRVSYVTAEDFTNRFVQAMRLGKLAAFRKHFRECDALLLDDLHFLAGKRATQEEFLHTLTSLLAEERCVVVSCDCHPRLTDQFAPELTDRMLGGAVWGLGLPDRDTRLAILRAKAPRSAATFPEEVLTLLAEQLRGNVRELEGALHSVGHLSRVTGRPIDVALAEETVGDFLRHSVRVVQLADVERAVCTVLGVEAAALQSKKRGWAYCHPRMLAMYLARAHTGATYTEIGQRFGGRNHSTTVAAEKKVRQWLHGDAALNLGERQLRVRDLIERVARELLR